MKPSLLVCLGLLCLGRISHPAFSQPAPAGVNLPAAVAAAQQQYADAFAGSSRLFNGPEYLDYARAYHERTGHQFFASPELQPGSLHYDGRYFSGVRLAYDVVRDQVVLAQPGTLLTLRLIDEKVHAFAINQHHFIRLVADSSAGRVIRTGFYELLLDSRIQVLAKRSKNLRESVAQQAVAVDFSSADKLFIKKAGVYYAITSKASAMRLFADRDQEVQQYAQTQHLKFNRDQREAAVLQLAQYYCTLAPQ
jgi:hypothetical protein